MPPTTAQPSLENKQATRFVSSVFAAWKTAGIEFLILRNYEGLPEFTTNDIDVLLSPGKRDRAEAILMAVARETEFHLHNRAEFATLACYFSSNVSTAQVHFDLFTDLKWRTFYFIEAGPFLSGRIPFKDFFIPRQGHEAVTNLLAHMIYTGQVKEKYKASIQEGFIAEGEQAQALLAQSYGAELAAKVIDLGKRANWRQLQALTPSLRKTLVSRQWTRTPFRTLGSTLADLRRIVGRALRPPGLMVVMCGADGSGKSTVSRAIQDRLAPSFSPAKSRQYHWKVPVVSGRRMAERKPTQEPHAQPPRSSIASLLYFAVHWFEFVVGPRLGLFRTLFRGGLVMIDRYYYDFFVDQRRYRLTLPNWLVKFGYASVRKPDLVLLLDAPSEVLQSRKKEVPIAETERQRNAFVRLVRSLPQGRVLDASKSVEDVSEEAKQVVLEFLRQRAAARPHCRAS